MSFGWHISNSANVFLVSGKGKRYARERERQKEIEENILSTVTALARGFCLYESFVMHVAQRQNKKHLVPRSLNSCTILIVYTIYIVQKLKMKFQLAPKNLFSVILLVYRSKVLTIQRHFY